MIECDHCHAGRHTMCIITIRSIGTCRCYRDDPLGHVAAMADPVRVAGDRARFDAAVADVEQGR